LANNLRYKKAAIVSYAELMAEGSPKFQEKLDSATSSSHLSPLVTHSPALIRYTSTPVYATSNTGTTKPDGVLISGDIMNGKTIAAERMLAVLGTGYAGFYFDSGNGDYRLATGILKATSDSAILVDYAVPPSSLKRLLDQVRADSTKIFSAEVEMDDAHVVLAAKRIPLDRFVGSFGDVDMDPEGPPIRFMVYGKRKSTFASLERNMSICTAICAVVQLLTTLYMNYKAYQPIKKLLTVMTK